jgi:hypothetical protein
MMDVKKENQKKQMVMEMKREKSDGDGSSPG